LAGHEARGLRTQEQPYATHFFRLRRPSDRAIVHQVLLEKWIIQPAFGHRGRNPSRGQCIDPNPLTGVVERRCLGQADYPVLRRHVGHPPGVGDDTGY
jgi:hypothetical protein